MREKTGEQDDRKSHLMGSIVKWGIEKKGRTKKKSTDKQNTEEQKLASSKWAEFKELEQSRMIVQRALSFFAFIDSLNKLATLSL